MDWQKFNRVNEKGVEGIWECWPKCGVKIPEEKEGKLRTRRSNRTRSNEGECGVLTRDSWNNTGVGDLVLESLLHMCH